ncbi:hypothetical protein AQUCO_01200222v1 [Aquilegia coerulea]|uniref:Kinesin-like protein n=1 Tax=Aquilegia coerulea TaxID=218851 RepID=A0A2G5E4U7_AQUCA|nr:hypothetical protein AQUCO_01200222v1 [Aquilegia coerulea]
MASFRSQNKPPLNTNLATSSLPIPSMKKASSGGNEIKKIGNGKLPNTSTRTRQVSITNVDSGSNAGSDCSGIEYTKEYIDEVLNEKLPQKNRFDIKMKCEHLGGRVKKLKDCIKWYGEVEESLLLEQQKLRSLVESSERKCVETEEKMGKRIEELDAEIVELKKNCACLEERLANVESEKMVATDALRREQEARVAVEKEQAALEERSQQELRIANQKIESLKKDCDTYKTNLKNSQEYNTSLQQYNATLQKDLETQKINHKRLEEEKVAIFKDNITVKGLYNRLQDDLASFQASRDEAIKKKEALKDEVGCLRAELKQVKDDRDHQQLEAHNLMEELAKCKEISGKSSSECYNVTTRLKALEEICSSQRETNQILQDQLAAANEKLKMSDMATWQTKTEFEEQSRLVQDLQNRLAEAESQILEGENLRKKLHNTILELKGNIRVFCRVRPLLPADGSNGEASVISFPTSAESLGRGINLIQNGQKHQFVFDKMFSHECSQQEVFVEISQLVQSALDGYKVCIFAYGQTGSGKTYTMMGKTDSPEQKGLIPRSLEQIFQSSQSLSCQGWKYKMQASMLEIYNETIHDLLSPNRASGAGNSNAGKTYTIQHDASGNTYVSDLTIVDVSTIREVSSLLQQAAQSRSVGKTRMNEQSSRSHMVFTLRISGFNESTEQQVQGVLNLIDLAGSERLSKSESTGSTLRETQAINKSLSSLSDVIFSLAKKEDHVPFRNSKLTYLLQPCLGGNSKTLMFVNISPDPSSMGESLCSLRFAARVNACEIGVPQRQICV